MLEKNLGEGVVMRVMRRFLMSMLLVLACQQAMATPQENERLEMDGKTIGINTEPLEPLLSKKKSSFSMFSKEDFADKLHRHMTGYCHTGLHRRYIATWLIQNDRLFLKKISACRKEEGLKAVPLSELFENHQGPIPAVWFSGQLVIPLGEMVKYVHMGYESEYEEYELIDFDDGVMLGRKIWQTEGKARKLCDSATKAGRANAKQLCNRAAAITLMKSGDRYAREDKLVEAEKDYLAALAKDPDFEQPYYDLAVLYVRQNRFEAAIKQLDEAYKHGNNAAFLVGDDDQFDSLRQDKVWGAVFKQKHEAAVKKRKAAALAAATRAPAQK